MPDVPRNAHRGSAETVVVGRILSPYGIKGWVHIAAFTDPKDNLMNYRPWLLGDDSQTEWRSVDVRDVRMHRQGLVASIAGVDDRAQAERVKGRLIGVPAEVLPEPEAGEHYWRDLIGAAVVNVQGAVLGRVSSLMETGAHDVLVVARADGAELLIPFHERFVLAVDAERICVDWPDGAGSDVDVER